MSKCKQQTYPLWLVVSSKQPSNLSRINSRPKGFAQGFIRSRDLNSHILERECQVFLDMIFTQFFINQLRLPISVARRSKKNFGSWRFSHFAGVDGGCCRCSDLLTISHNSHTSIANNCQCVLIQFKELEVFNNWILRKDLFWIYINIQVHRDYQQIVIPYIRNSAHPEIPILSSSHRRNIFWDLDNGSKWASMSSFSILSYISNILTISIYCVV